jgi:alpha-L-rhamnosidase
MAPTAPRFDHHDAGPVLGIGTATPRLSWTMPSAEPDYEQRSYRVEVRLESDEPQVSTVESAEQLLVDWPAAPLRSRQRAEVRVAANDGEWSEPAVVEAGLLDPSDWTARFISPAGIARLEQPAPVLTGRLTVPGDVARARLYITAHGLYEAELNGQRVGDQQLTPGWTSYDHRLRYQTYDVTDLLRDGENRLDVLLGNGWYRGRLGFRGQRAVYGDRLALLAQLEVTTADGQVHVLASGDGSWTARESQVVADDLYDGQHTDLRRATDGAESGVEEIPADLGRLVAPDGPPVRITDVLPAVEVTRQGDKTLIDFGQNVVGWVRLTVRGRAGQQVTLRHAEVLEHGELGVRPLRTAKATDSWILAGDGEVTLEPTLTFHGFRYAEVTGAEVDAERIHAVVVGSDLARTGWFESSSELLNRFHENVVWGMRGNFLDVPTDCPQRDERLGWTGDIQVFAPSASFLFNAAGFLTNWLADLAVDQQKDGSVPFVIPDVIRQPGPAATAWGDAATLVPWVIYQRFGDVGILRRQLPSMRAWVDKMADLAGPDLLWSGGFQFGDWLDPTAPPDNPFQAKADPDVIATAHFARSAEVVARAAELIGDTDTAGRYGELAARVREAFAREYVTGGGRVLSDSATAYGLALQWALLPGAEQRRHAGERLADLVRTAGFRISTGFVGTPLMTDALTDAGQPELAYRLLLQTGCPSWLYSVTMGATTVWERWDSMLPDGSINPGQMTSFNHYALGAVADWMHRRVAGLAPGAPGYRELDVRPVPGRGLTSAAARHLTPYGEAKVAWQRRDGRLTLEVTVPVGVTATVLVPGESEPATVRHGEHRWEVADPVRDEPLPADATIRQLLDHEPTWRKVVEAAVGTGVVADDAELAGRLARYLDAPASQLVESAMPRGFVPGAEEFEARLAGILP